MGKHEKKLQKEKLSEEEQKDRAQENPEKYLEENLKNLKK